MNKYNKYTARNVAHYLKEAQADTYMCVSNALDVLFSI